MPAGLTLPPRLEKAVEAAGVRALEKRGYDAPKYKTPGRRSAPDRIVLAGLHRCFFIEFKQAGKKATPKQLVEHEKLRRRGYLVFVCHDTGETLLAADQFERETQKLVRARPA